MYFLVLTCDLKHRYPGSLSVMANDTLIPTPVGRGGKEINVALDLEREKFYKLKTQLSNCEAENGLVI